MDSQTKKADIFLKRAPLILIFFFCLGFFGQQTGDAIYSSSESTYFASALEPLVDCQVNISDNTTPLHKNHVFKQHLKKKIKVKYRAMYCQLKLTHRFHQKHQNFYKSSNAFIYADCFAQKQFVNSHTLRGPPTFPA